MALRAFFTLIDDPSAESFLSDDDIYDIFLSVSVKIRYRSAKVAASDYVEVRFHHEDYHLTWRVDVPYSEVAEGGPRTHARLLWRTYVETPPLIGPVLGDSGRIDSVRARDAVKALSVDSFSANNISHTNDGSPTTTADGLGRLGKLPRELRAEIYKHAFPETFWQSYRPTQTGLALLGKSHSDSQTPNLLRTSSIMRKECLESAYVGNISPTIIVGSQVIAFNFPLQAGMVAGQIADATKSQIPSADELFIGVQTPSPRSFDGMAMVRLQVKRIPNLINAIATNQHIPPIRVSFETNKSRTGPHYPRSDFEMLLSPLHQLRPPPPDAAFKYRSPVTIDRAVYTQHPNPKLLATCHLIESATSHPHSDTSLITYRQLVIDIKIELAFRPPGNKPHGTQHMAQRRFYIGALRRLTQTAKDLVAWYHVRGVDCPSWLNVLHAAVAGESIDHDVVRNVAGLVVWDQARRRVDGLGNLADLGAWASGHMSVFNPFFKEGEQDYWA